MLVLIVWFTGDVNVWHLSIHSTKKAINKSERIKPDITATVFAREMDVRAWGMNRLKEIDSGLKKAHQILSRGADSPNGKAVSTLLHNIFWLRCQFPLETIQVARDCNFDYRDGEMRAHAFQLFGGPANSKHTAEDVFGHLANIVQRSTKGNKKMNKSLAKNILGILC